MNKKKRLNCIDKNLYNNLLVELQVLEVKCDRITDELSEVKRLIIALPPDINILVEKILYSANEMHEQSIRHRKYVERCINGEVMVHLVREGNNE